MRITTLRVLPLLLAGVLQAQDNHYWTRQYGARSALLSGATVGSVRDSSAAFYNPGGLGFITNPDISVSGNAYQLEQLSLENGAGTDDDLTSTEFVPIPSLVSGV